MKRALLSLGLISLLTQPSFAKPQKEYHKLKIPTQSFTCENAKSNAEYPPGFYQTLPHTCGYHIEILTTNSSAQHNITNSLIIRIANSQTQVEIVDLGMDGLTSGDHVCITHNWKGGASFYSTITSHGGNEFSIYSGIAQDSKPLWSTSFSTLNINPVKKFFFLQSRTAPLFEWGKKNYQEILAAQREQRPPILPYRLADQAIKDLEALIPVIKADPKNNKDALKPFGRKYSTAIKN